MSKVIFKTLILLISLNLCAQEDYAFINEVITPYEKDNPIPKDTIFLSNKFLDLKNNFKYLNKETLKIWWGINLDNPRLENTITPPIALFFKNFNLEKISKKIKNTPEEDIIKNTILEKYFYLCDTKYRANNIKKSYLQISRPYFNKKKDWCFIVKETSNYYFDVSTGKVICIYVKVNKKWVLYNKITLSLS